MQMPNNIDVLQIDKKQLEKLMEWKDNNKEVVRNFNPIIEEGIINIFQHTSVYFTLKDDIISFRFYLFDKSHNEDTYILSLDYDFLNLQIFNLNISKDKNRIVSYFREDVLKLDNDNNLTKETQMLIQDIITVYASSMAYMQYYKKDLIENVVEVKLTKKDSQRLEKQKKHNNTINNNSNVITIKNTKKVYLFPDREKIKTNIIPKREIKLDAWRVRGHNRKLSNGKEVYIKPYIKGKNKDKIQNKIYKFEIE